VRKGAGTEYEKERSAICVFVGGKKIGEKINVPITCLGRSGGEHVLLERDIRGGEGGL